MNSPRPVASTDEALKILGLPPASTAEEVRSAYRRLAFEFHPDRHAGNPEMEGRFKEISRAYQTLISDSFPGDGSAVGHPLRKGQDLFYDVQMDFITAVSGGDVSVLIKRPFVCPGCDGISSEGCQECGGDGTVLEEAMVRVQLPTGLEDGEVVRVPHEGAPGTGGGGPGDLILTVRSSRHPALERRGVDVHSEVRVPRFRMNRGGPVRVFTVRGGAQVDIPPGTPPGRTFRMRGWGIERSRDGRTFRGDHVVRILAMPEKEEG